MTEALRRENEVMRALLRRWVDEAEWSIMTVGYWGDPDLYVCDWCRGDGDSPDSIEHAPSCLVGQMLKVVNGERQEVNDGD